MGEWQCSAPVTIFPPGDRLPKRKGHILSIIILSSNYCRVDIRYVCLVCADGCMFLIKQSELVSGQVLVSPHSHRLLPLLYEEVRFSGSYYFPSGSKLASCRLLIHGTRFFFSFRIPGVRTFAKPDFKQFQNKTMVLTCLARVHMHRI